MRGLVPFDVIHLLKRQGFILHAVVIATTKRYDMFYLYLAIKQFAGRNGIAGENAVARSLLLQFLPEHNLLKITSRGLCNVKFFLQQCANTIIFFLILPIPLFDFGAGRPGVLQVAGQFNMNSDRRAAQAVNNSVDHHAQLVKRHMHTGIGNLAVLPGVFIAFIGGFVAVCFRLCAPDRFRHDFGVIGQFS